ncbi:MAG: sensor histidine kinase [Christensenellaceae bacterium]|nr:sensor histidine kinase [Christensenellaceae bacterium]
MTLRKRLFIYLVLVSVIPVLLVGGISYFLAVGNITENAVDANLSVSDRVSSDTAKMLENCFNMAYSFEDTISYQTAMRTEFTSRQNKYATEIRVSLNMYVEAKYRPEIFGIYLIGENGGAYKSSFCTFLNDNLNEMDLYKRAFVCEEITYLGSYMGSQIVSSLDIPMFSFGKVYRDKATGQKNGVVIIEIEQEKILDLLSFDLGSSSYMALINKSNDVIASVGSNENFDEYMSRYGTRSIKTVTHSNSNQSFIYDTSPIIIRTPVNNQEFSILNIVPERDIVRQAQYISLIISLLILVVTVLALLASWNISDKVTKPIKKLVSLMHRVELGDLTVSFSPKYDDEIGLLFRSFNIMVDRVNMLMLSIQDEQKKLRTSEMRALMNQINPHFLYNTLDSIVWMCRAGKTAQAADMTDALASFFRIGLSKGRDIITVEEELLHIKNYLMIQEYRGEDSFDYHIDADESLYKYATVKFILQPLVENAIYHGIFKQHKKGHIFIDLYEEDSNIVMSVSDTGPGMMPDAVSKLTNTLKKETQGSNESYGLVNVNQRIKGFFGDEYGLRFFSVYGQGSTFEIVIPKFKEEEEC